MTLAVSELKMKYERDQERFQTENQDLQRRLDQTKIELTSTTQTKAMLERQEQQRIIDNRLLKE
jgi:hypothetical protein